MVAPKNTQTLTDFRQKVAETLDRINQTGDAELITFNGEARAVLLSPAVYDEMASELQLSRDVAAIRTSVEQIEQGKFQEAGAFFGGLRTNLLAMKDFQEKGSVE